MPSEIKPVLSPNAPKPIGPYSQAIQVGHLLFCSGQIPLDPATGQMLVGASVEDETHLVMKNLGAVLAAAGASYDHVVKTTIFLKSMADFPKVNEIYGSYFKNVPPARSTIEVARLPKDAQVEVEAIAVLG